MPLPSHCTVIDAAGGEMTGALSSCLKIWVSIEEEESGLRNGRKTATNEHTTTTTTTNTQ